MEFHKAADGKSGEATNINKNEIIFQPQMVATIWNGGEMTININRINNIFTA